jgi:hypothetical protein
MGISPEMNLFKSTKTRTLFSSMRKARVHVFAVAVLTIGILIFSQVFAATGVPQIINFQGRLLDSGANLLGGSGTNYCFRFSLYDATSGGTKLWPSSTPSTMTLPVRQGVFDAGIGDTVAGGDTLNYDFQSNNAVYVNVEVAPQSGGSCAGVTFETLSPRQRVESSGYAINSGTLDGFTASQSATVNQIPVLTSGALVLGDAAASVQATGTTALTLQGTGATGNIQFFTNANNLTSAGALTLAGGLTTTAVNGNTITSGTGTLTLAAGKTFTASNTLTLAGTDGSTLNVGAGGTLGSAAFTSSSAYQAPITLTTTGTSGAATFAAGTLNIPQYSGAVYTAGTGLTLTTGAFSVNTSQNIATLSNLTANGIVSTSGGTGALSVIATTGSGSVVLATSPTLVTPTLGAASATTINGLTLTASTGTLTIANAKTFTISNTLTLAGTDGSTLNIGSGGTLGTAAYTASSAYQAPITLTTTGTSGAATFAGNTLNIPQYAGASYTAGTGLTLTAGAFSVNTSQNITNLTNLNTAGLVKTTGTGGALSIAIGDTDYQKPVTLTTTGTSGAATFSGDTLNIPQYAGTSYAAGTGLTLTGSTFSVNTSQNIATLSNLSTNGILSTTGGTGTLAVTATTGSGSVVLSTSPTLVTPTLGAALATSINGNTITASTGTLTLTAGKTFTDLNTLTLAGTDGSTLNVGAGGTLGSAAFTSSSAYQAPITLTTTGTSGAATFIGNTLNVPQYTGGVTSVSNADGTLTISPTTGAVVVSLALGHANTWTGAQTISGASFSTLGNQTASAWGVNGINFSTTAATYTDSSSSGSVANNMVNTFGIPTLAASSATTYTNAATVYIAGAPVAGTNTTITNAYGLSVNANVNIGNGTTGTLHLGDSTIQKTSGTGFSFGSGIITGNVSSNGSNSTLSLQTNNAYTTATTGVTINPFSVTNASGTFVDLSITPTYNQTSTAAATDLLINRTQTAVGSGAQLLADFQVGGTSKFKVDNTGAVVAVGAISGSNLSGTNTGDQTAGTGLTLTTGAFSVNTSQNISTLSNLTSNGLIKTSGGTGALSIATAGTDYQAPVTLTTTGTSGAATFIGNTLNIPQYPGGASYTFSTGLTNTSGTITVNTSQNISTLSNLTSNGIVSTTGGTGTLTIVSTTGSGNVALANSPTFVTPTLGDAIANTINGDTITPSSGVLTIAGGKTFTASNSVAIAGNDGSTLNIGTGGTLGTAAYTNTGSYQSPIALTTTGNSGASTLVGNTLNIPIYTGNVYTAGAGLTLSSGAFSVNTSQNITNLTNFISNGVLTVSGGTGTLGVTSTTGTGNIVLGTSPTLVTPTLGNATATTINKVTITAPALAATLTIADGKIFTASNTITLAGTDGSTLNIGAGGTLGSAAYTSSGAYEVPLTFSTGLTRTSNTITNNLAVGVSGGQTAIGGTGVTDILSLKGTTGNGTATNAAINFLVGNNGATTAATILNNGNVGIGNAAPTFPLQVTNTATQARIEYDSTHGLSVGVASNGVINFTSSTIGTFLTANASNLLSTTQQFSVTNAQAANTATFTHNATGLTSSGLAATSIAENSTYNTTAGALTSYGIRAVNTANTTSGSFAMTDVGLYVTATGGNTNYAAIFDQGSVGIGTTAPAATLEVDGASGTVGNGTLLRLTSTSASAADVGATLQFRETNSNGANRFAGEISGRTETGADRAYLQFVTNGDGGNLERMRIDSHGNVGIGTTSISSSLSFGGTSAKSLGMERNTTAATAGQGFTITSGGAIAGTADLAGGDLTLKSGTSTGTGSSALHFYTATASTTGISDNTPTEKLTILGSGNVGIGTNAPSGLLSLAGNQTASAWGTAGINFQTAAATYTDSSSSAGTVTNNMVNTFGIPTLATTTNAVTYTNAGTVYIAGGPAAGSHVTETNKYGLIIAADGFNSTGNSLINAGNATTTFGSGSALTKGFVDVARGNTSATNFAILSTTIPNSTASSGIVVGLLSLPQVSQSGTAGYTGVLVNATESSTGSGNKYLYDGQVGGVSKFHVNDTGGLTTAGAVILSNLSSNGLVKTSGGTGALSIATAGTDYQAPVTLTTTGSSGAATFIGNTLNVPNYGSGITTYTFSTGLTNTSGTVTNNLSTGVSGGQTAIGGTGVTDVLSLKGTTGNGTATNAAINFLVGNNGATTAATILNNGNVGIGVTTPGQALDVRGYGSFSDGSSGLLVGAFTGGGYGALYPYGVTPANNNYVFAANSTTTFVNGGSALNLAVGTTNILTLSSTGSNVTGYGKFGTGSGNNGLVIGAYSGGGYGTIYPYGVTPAGNNFVLSTNDGTNTAINGGSSVALEIAAGPVAYITSTGLGVGGAGATSLLSLSGNQTASAWGTAGVNFSTVAATYTDSSSAAGTVTNNVVNAFGIPTLATSSNTVTYTNAATVYIAGAPVAGSHVTETNAYALYVASGLSQFGNSSVTTGTTVATFQNAGGTCNIVPSTAGGVTCSSDMNLKKNITTLSDNSAWSYNNNITISNQTVLTKILALTPVEYNWNVEQDTDPKHAGFIAQEVQQVFPDLVMQNPTTHLLSLNYSGLVPYTIQAIKEMNVTLSDLPTYTDPTLAQKIATFLDGIATRGEAVVNLVIAKKVTTQELCIGNTASDSVCVTKSQLQQLLQQAGNNNGGGSSAPSNPPASNNPPAASGSGSDQSPTTPPATVTPPPSDTTSTAPSTSDSSSSTTSSSAPASGSSTPAGQ